MSDLFVQHRVYHYVGMVIGKTKMSPRCEHQQDVEECRVRLPSGKIWIASEANLRPIDSAEYHRLCRSLSRETLTGGRPRRFGTYRERVQTTLSTFWTSGQVLECIKIFRCPDSTCQMCGHEPITWNHVLQNRDTGRELIVGRKCIKYYHVLTQEQVIFPHYFRRAATYLNARCPNCVAIAARPPWEDDNYPEPEWIDPDDPRVNLHNDIEMYPDEIKWVYPDEIDWESEDFERD